MAKPAAITPSYRLVGPESSVALAGTTTTTLVFRPERQIPGNGKLILDLPAATFGTSYVTSISVDGQNVVSGAGRVPTVVFGPLSEHNDLRLPMFSSITPLRVVLVWSGTLAANADLSAAVIPPDRLNEGVQRAAARGRRIVRGRRRPMRALPFRRGRRLRGFDDFDDDDLDLGAYSDEELIEMDEELGAIEDVPDDVALGLGELPDDVALGLGAYGLDDYY